jgi:protein-disulfide isomerase
MKGQRSLNNLVWVSLFFSLLSLVLVFDLYQKNGYLSDAGSKNKVAGEELAQPSNQPRVEVSIGNAAIKGLGSAPITIIEFGDFQCPYCEVFFNQVLPEIEKKYINSGKVKFVYREFPLSFHQYAQKASEAAGCAGEQGKFWDYHDKLFENQNSLDLASLKSYAQQLHLNTAKFNDCLDSGKMAAAVQKDISDGSSYGVTGTPTFFVNGVMINGAQPFSEFEKIIDQELKR